jgi:hypothetical protein
MKGPGQFVLMTIRSHDQYNTTIYGLDDRYRGISHGRRVVFIIGAVKPCHSWRGYKAPARANAKR